MSRSQNRECVTGALHIVKSGCVGVVKTENSEIPTMSHDVPTVSLRLLYDS